MSHKIFRGIRNLALVVLILAIAVACRYEAPLAPAPGYTLQWATPPSGLESYTRSVERFLELTSLSCNHVLLGWGDADTLYYSKKCPGSERSQPPVLFRFQLSVETTTAVDEIPTNLFTTRINKVDVLAHVRAYSVRPTEYETMTRQLHIKSDGLLSTDKQHIAIVTKWLYGPEDVMILSRTN